MITEPAPDQLETSEGLWSEDGTGSRLFGSLENHQNGDVQSQGSSQNRANLGAKPKQVKHLCIILMIIFNCPAEHILARCPDKTTLQTLLA